MQISLNGEKTTLEDQSTLLSLLANRCFANRTGTAVAVNNTVIPKSRWEDHVLAENDRVLVIAATKGG